MSLSEHARRLLDGGNILTVATVNPDGSPQTTAVWCRTDGDDVVFSTVEGRRKHLNFQRDPRVSVSVFDPASPFDRVEIRGHVTITGDPDGALIDDLSHRYAGRPAVRTGPVRKACCRTGHRTQGGGAARLPVVTCRCPRAAQQVRSSTAPRSCPKGERLAPALRSQTSHYRR